MKKNWNCRFLPTRGKWLKSYWLMRNFIILFFALNLSAFANGLSQGVSLARYKQATLIEVFEDIKVQTGYGILYKLQDINPDIRVNMNVENTSVQEILGNVLEGTNLDYKVQDEVIVIFKAEKRNQPKEIDRKQEKKTIKGKVTDKDGMPLPGVTVLVKGKNQGTVSDIEGGYTIDVTDETAVLVFSFIGFVSQEIQVGSMPKIDIVLVSDMVGLEEVAVYATGYTKISKERASGSYEVIGKSTVENSPVENISGILEGAATGVQVQSDAEGNVTNIEIRGRSTITSNASPLVVVDGFPVDGDFSTINPNDVESITILKDAAAASIWGARAGNGVIVVTTKKNRKNKFKVSVESFMKIGQKADLDYLLPSASNKTTLQYDKWISDNEYGTTFGTPGTLANVWMNYNHASQAYLDYKKGDISKADLDNILTRLEKTDFKDDIDKYLMQTPVTHQHNISLSGGGERGGYFLSALYNNYKGGSVGNEKEKLLINFRSNYKVAKWLDFDFSMMTEINERRPNYVTLGTVNRLSPYQNLVNEDGTFASVIKAGGHNQQFIDEFASKIDGLPYSNWRYNPYQDIQNAKEKYNGWNTRIQTGLNAEILEGLTFRSSFQFEKFRTNGEVHYGEDSYYVRDLVNDNVDYDSNTNSITRTYIPKGDILNKNWRDRRTYTLRNQLNFDRVFSNIHEINVALGSETTWRTTETFSDRIYGYNDENLSFVNPPYGNGSADVRWKLLTNPWETGSVPSGNQLRYYSDRFFSIYGNLAYTYKQKYTLTGSYRTDASNIIVKDSKYRYSPLWSAGVSWNLKREDFLKDNELFDRLIARVTYGENGNMVSWASTVPLITLSGSPSPATGSFYANVGDKGNPTLRWEKVNQTNVGIDFAMLNRSISGTINYYNKHSDGLLAEVSLPSTYGSTVQSFNAAELSNKGIEFELNYHLKTDSELSWTSGFNVSYNKSEVLSLNVDQINPQYLLNGIYDYDNFIEGYPHRPIFAWVYGGYDSEVHPELPLIVNDSDPSIKYTMNENIGQNGEYGPDVLRYMGSAIAPTVLGWTNTVNFKNFTFSAVMVGKFGHVFRRQTFNYNQSPMYLGYYHKDLEEIISGNAASLGLPSLPEQYNNRFYQWGRYVPNLNTMVEDASHIRLREVYLAYNLPDHILSRLSINKFKLFVHARNLGLLWTANDKDLDPEYVSGVSQKPVKTYTFGLSLEF